MKFDNYYNQTVYKVHIRFGILLNIDIVYSFLIKHKLPLIKIIIIALTVTQCVAEVELLQ